MQLHLDLKLDKQNRENLDLTNKIEIKKYQEQIKQLKEQIERNLEINDHSMDEFMNEIKKGLDES